MFEILSKEMLTGSVCRHIVHAPRISASAQPGQFLIAISDDGAERIPLTISGSDAAKGTISVVVQAIGASTKRIVALEAGDSYADILGPLGNPSDFVKRDVRGESWVLIAGGLGAAPIFPQAEWLHSYGARVEVILGAKSESLLIYTEELSGVCDELHICTDDGSCGFHGLVTAKLQALCEEGRHYDRCVAIGPMIMMKFAARTCGTLGIPVTVSLNSIMVDGTGMCGACRVSVGGKMRFACVDGPEFDGSEVDFDEALHRQGQYRAEEAAVNSKCGCNG